MHNNYIKNRKQLKSWGLPSDKFVMATFRFTQTFDSRLTEVSRKLGKSKTAVIVDSVNAYASNTLPDKDMIDLYKNLQSENEELKNKIDELHTICLQILKNQHTH